MRNVSNSLIFFYGNGNMLSRLCRINGKSRVKFILPTLMAFLLTSYVLTLAWRSAFTSIVIQHFISCHSTTTNPFPNNGQRQRLGVNDIRWNNVKTYSIIKWIYYSTKSPSNHAGKWTKYDILLIHERWIVTILQVRGNSPCLINCLLGANSVWKQTNILPH